MPKKGFIFVLLSLFLLTACHKDNGEDEPDTRTVLIYMMADNSLSSFSSTDISEMIKGMGSVDVSKNNLLIYLDTYDGTPKLIKLDEKNGNIVQTIVKTYDEQISTDESVMKTVFSYVFSEYPAKSYGLDLWSHGEGWIPATSASKGVISRWIGVDQNGGSNRYYLNISTLASVLSSVPHFDFILFDACFMSSVEVYYDLRSHSDYFISSATEIPGPGAYYADVVPAMFASSNDGEKVTEAYYDYYNKIYAAGVGISNDKWTSGVSVALVKSSGLESLASATKSILAKYVQSGTSISVSDIFCYDPYRNNYYTDLDGLMQKVSGGGTDYQSWKTVFNQCVPVYLTTATNYMSYSDGSMDAARSMTGSAGLSTYVPRSTMSTVNTYFKNTGWYTAAGWNNLGW